MFKEFVGRSEPCGLYGGVYYDPENPESTWRVSGAVGVDALYEALAANPAGVISSAEVSAGFQVIDEVVRRVDGVIDDGGWVLTGKEPESLPAGVTAELLGDLRDKRVLLTTPRIFQLDYGLSLPSESSETDKSVALVTPGLSQHLRYHVTEYGFTSGLTLLCDQNEQKRNIEVPKQLLNGLVMVTNRSVQAEADLSKLPFPSVQLVKQRFVDRAKRIAVVGG